MSEPTEIKPLDLSPGLTKPTPMSDVKGVKARTGKYVGHCYLSNFSAGGGSIHLGTFKNVADAARKWDAAKCLFFLLTGQAGKLVDRRQFNSPAEAAKWSPADAKAILGAGLTTKVEALSAKWLQCGGSINRPWADRATKTEFAERLQNAEKKIARLESLVDRLLKRPRTLCLSEIPDTTPDTTPNA